ncbi:MAG: PepSY domain-containing protein [Beijerinckiaceae bacterium]|nr:PepSY domain-containing protein [Beijerinckiaceae bacterium]
MSKPPFNRIACASLAILMMAGAAQAQGIEFGPGGLRIDPGPERYAPRPRFDGISEREAVRIARRQGVEEVERVRETPRGWRISGLDRNGDEIRVIISRDGDVVDVR